MKRIGGGGGAEAFEVVVLGGRAWSGRVAGVGGEKDEIAGEGRVGVVGAAGGVAGIDGGGVGGRGGAGGGKEEGSDHGNAGREVEREELAFVEELVGGAENGGGFAGRD